MKLLRDGCILLALALVGSTAWAGCPGNACAAGKAKEEVKEACCGKCGGNKAKCGAEDAKCGKSKKCGESKECEAGTKCKTCPSEKKSKCGGCPVKEEAKADTHGHQHKAAAITVEALEALLNSGKDVVVLDARSAEYDDGRRIPGAKSLSYTADAEAAAKVIASKDQLVVTYCANTKCPASERLAGRLHELGYKNVVELPVGIAGWTEAGKKTTKVN